MTATTLKQTEGRPAVSRTSIGGVPGTEVYGELAWVRIEQWTNHRWAPRSVAWVVEGPGEWVPPLQPATISTVEVWSSADVWEPAALSPSPLGGYWLPCTGPYRFTGTVGLEGVYPPREVYEAARRLSEYMDAKPGQHPGASSETLEISDAVQLSYNRSPEWLARAMVNSGAADLLRPWRRAR